RLADYVSRASKEAWEVETEKPFSVQVDRALLSGRADRIHIKDDAARIVDLKTSRYAISKDAAQGNAQLAMYQVAAACGGFAGVTKTAGAELVFLGYQGDPVRIQDPIDHDEAVCRLGAIVTQLSGAEFDAVVSEDCRNCPVIRSCPAWPEGGQVSGS
ncbi:MAG: PD-(D/E)XK nuclease family protein, partial [Demequinaceae bacterium]|nr:PD-(D/E)XK nuclease family protein [Demequinaceae bacterium]